MAMSRWLSFVPERLGTSSALDKAVRCFTAHHVATTHGNEQMVRYGRVVYGQALSSLQKSLYDPMAVTSSERLCATMLLCMYEVGIVSTL